LPGKGRKWGEKKKQIAADPKMDVPCDHRLGKRKGKKGRPNAGGRTGKNMK